jgi:hypothetical protein
VVGSKEIDGSPCHHFLLPNTVNSNIIHPKRQESVPHKAFSVDDTFHSHLIICLLFNEKNAYIVLENQAIHMFRC